MVWHAVQSVVALLLVMAVGFFMAGADWYKQHGPGIFSKYASRIAIPVHVFSNILQTVPNRAGLLQLLQGAPVPLLSIGINFALAFLLLRLLRVPAARAGVFVNGFALGNIVFVGFPVVQLLLGDNALSSGMVYYMSNTVWFWTLGVGLLRYFAGDKSGLFTKQGLKNILSPALVALVLGLAVKALDISLPFVITYPLDVIGKTATGICLLFIGGVIRGTNLKKLSLSRDLVGLLVGRFVLSPLVAFLVGLALPVSLQLRQVMFLLSVMPAMTQLGIMARETGSDYEYASVAISVTTLVSLVCIPAYMALGQVLGLFP